jgi:GAF domain-containing protein
MLQQFRQEQTNLGITDIDEIRRQVGIGIMTVLVFVGVVFNIITLSTGVSLSGRPTFIPFIIAAVSLVARIMLRRNQFVRPVLHLPIVVFVTAVLTIRSEIGFSAVIFLILIYAAVMTRLRFYGVLSIVMLLLSAYLQLTLPQFPYTLMTIVALTVGGIVFYVVHQFEQTASIAIRTNRLLQGSSNIAQIINQELEVQQLLDSTVNTIREEFDFYHVQVFLIDESFTYANLIASTGEAGRQLLARNHRLPVGSQSVVGRATQIGEPIVTQDTGVDTVHSINELLPDTQAELALPIIDSGNIIGALDVQSINATAFQPVDIQALQIVANQLAVAIRNARLFDQAQHNINENKRLVFEYETNLREVDRLNRSLTKQSWDSYLTQSYVDGVTLSKDRFVPRADWSDAMRTATTQQQTHIVASDETNLIAVPIILRGQVLGAIEVELDGTTSTSDSTEMIQAISQRLAISLESARLFEETQEATLQEQQINEIVTSYETAVTIDELLQVTLEKLQQSLGAEEGKIRLGTFGTNGTSQHIHNGGESS